MTRHRHYGIWMLTKGLALVRFGRAGTRSCGRAGRYTWAYWTWPLLGSYGSAGRGIARAKCRSSEASTELGSLEEVGGRRRGGERRDGESADQLRRERVATRRAADGSAGGAIMARLRGRRATPCRRYRSRLLAVAVNLFASKAARRRAIPSPRTRPRRPPNCEFKPRLPPRPPTSTFGRSF